MIRSVLRKTKWFTQKRNAEERVMLLSKVKWFGELSKIAVIGEICAVDMAYDVTALKFDTEPYRMLN